MKRFIGVILVGALLLGWGVRPADARSAAQLRWEGAAIALGTVGLIAVLSDVAHAQPVAVGVGGWYLGYPEPQYCPPPPPPRSRIWVSGYWEEIEVWVPGVWLTTSRHADGCRGRGERHRGYGRGGSHDHDRCGFSHTAREDRGRYERRRVWKEGYYR